MIKKKFSGFTKDQIEKLARATGFEGPMEQYNKFLASSPDAAAKLARFTERARSMVEDDFANAEHMAEGGQVNKPQPQVATGMSPSTEMLTDPKLKLEERMITPVKVRGVERGEAQFIDKNSGSAGQAEQAKRHDPAPALTADQTRKTDAHTVRTDLAATDVNKVAAQTKAAKGTVSKKAQMEAATALPSADATVAGQMEKLLSQFDEGNTPPWAAGAMRKATTIMAQRGLGSSSMAGAAITQAAMESTLEIAVRDASTFSQFEMQNLNNRQQARLVNAQAFLQMDMANLANEQQTSLFKAQARIQALFTDQAAENASRQFNATSQNQTDQFFANLQTQVKTFNAAQQNAMRMFNAEQKNTIKMFNAQQRNQREEFNANNRLIVDQANAKWRQQIATINNANINEANRINAQNATGLTLAAYNNLWQNERDLMAFAFTAAENATQRAHEVVLQKLVGESYENMADKQAQVDLGRAAGDFIGSIVDGIDWSGIF